MSKIDWILMLTSMNHVIWASVLREWPPRVLAAAAEDEAESEDAVEVRVEAECSGAPKSFEPEPAVTAAVTASWPETPETELTEGVKLAGMWPWPWICRLAATERT